jgi:hypothetical protein
MTTRRYIPEDSKLQLLNLFLVSIETIISWHCSQKLPVGYYLEQANYMQHLHILLRSSVMLSYIHDYISQMTSFHEMFRAKICIYSCVFRVFHIPSCLISSSQEYCMNITNYECPYIIFNNLLLHTSSSSYGSTAEIGPWPPLLGFRNNNLFTGLDC